MRAHNATSPVSDSSPIHRTLVGVAIPLAGVMLAIAGCSNIKPHVPPSQGHITQPKQAAPSTASIPPPARSTMLVPPPVAQPKPQTYSVVVHEVPVKELLLALARDTQQNIDIHPSLSGLVSLNAINETLPAILERVSRQINMRYRTEGRTIVVSPDTPYVKTYRVNYVNVSRTTESSIGATGEISPAGASSGGASGGGGSAASSTSGSSTRVKSEIINRFWDQMRDNIRSILNSTRLQSLTAEAKAERLALVKQEQEIRVKQLEAASRAGQGAAPALTSSASTAAQQTTLLADDVVVNAVGGTITVNATEAQHKLVQQHIDSVTSAAHRQVLIEATIVEVTLSDAYQAGIDWSRLAVSGGFAVSQSLGAGFAGAVTAAGGTAGNAFTIAYSNPVTNVGNLSGTVRLLQEFGNSRVMSSPKLMAMNNQTALLKVVDNIVYFDVQAQTTTGSTSPSTTTFSTTAKTVAVGMVMGVTPQINEDGRVLLTVRPTISRLRPSQPFVNDPNPSLCDANRTNCVANPVPQVQVREMESVLQVQSGQTVILGGLMQDDIRANREQIPGAENAGSFSELFKFRDERASKTELVVFLRPTIIQSASLQSDELKFFQRFLPPEATGTRPAAQPAPAAKP